MRTMAFKLMLFSALAVLCMGMAMAEENNTTEVNNVSVEEVAVEVVAENASENVTENVSAEVAVEEIIEITNITATGDDEFIEVVNNGEEASEFINDSIVIDENATIISLPEFVIEPMSMVTIHFGAGETNETVIYLGENATVLNDMAGNVAIVDAEGNVIAELDY